MILLGAITLLFSNYSTLKANEIDYAPVTKELKNKFNENSNNETETEDNSELYEDEADIEEIDDETELEEDESDLDDVELNEESENIDIGKNILATVFAQAKFYVDTPKAKNKITIAKNRATKAKFKNIVKARTLFDKALKHEKLGGRKRIQLKTSARSRLAKLINACKAFCTYDRCGGTSQNDARVFNACAYYCEPARMEIKQCFRNVESFYPGFETNRAGIPTGMNFELRTTATSKARERLLGAGEAAKQEIANILDAMQAKREEIGGIKGVGRAIGTGIKKSGERLAKGVYVVGKGTKKKIYSAGKGIKRRLSNIKAPKLSLNFLKRCGCQKPVIERLNKILAYVEDTNAAAHHVMQFVEEIQNNMVRKRSSKRITDAKHSGITIEEIDDNMPPRRNRDKRRARRIRGR